MALPTAVAFPTPLPTATPVTSGFPGVSHARIIPIEGRYTKKYGVGIPLDLDWEGLVLLSPKHIIDPTQVGWEGGLVANYGVHFVSSDGLDVRLFDFAAVGDESLDIGFGWVGLDIAETVPHTRFEIAPPGTDIKVGDEVRIVTADFVRDDARKVVSHHRVLDGIVSNVDDSSNQLTLSSTIVGGNSGAAVLNSDMHLIGMVVAFYGGSPSTGGRAVAVHVDAIRSKLCEWKLLSGSDCD